MIIPNKKKKPRTPERLPDESARAYRAFCIYRDLGPNRTLDGAWKKFRHPPTGKIRKWSRHPGAWGAWSVEFNWVKRAEKHDDSIEEERAEIAVQQRWKLEQRRLQVEIEAQTTIENIARESAERTLRLLKAPLHDVIVENHDPVSHTRTTTKLLAPKGKELAAMMQAGAEAYSVAILGVRGVIEEEDQEDEGQITRITWERPQEDDEDESEDEDPDKDKPKVKKPDANKPNVEEPFDPDTDPFIGQREAA